jgi:hypothetical protein
VVCWRGLAVGNGTRDSVYRPAARAAAAMSKSPPNHRLHRQRWPPTSGAELAGRDPETRLRPLAAACLA